MEADAGAGVGGDNRSLSSVPENDSHEMAVGHEDEATGSPLGMKAELPRSGSSGADDSPTDACTDSATTDDDDVGCSEDPGMPDDPPLDDQWRTLTTQLANLSSGLDMMKDRLDRRDAGDAGDEVAFGDFQSVQHLQDFADFSTLDAPPHWSGPLPPRPSSHAVPSTEIAATAQGGLIVSVSSDEEDAQCDDKADCRDIAHNNQCGEWRDELRKMERLHDSLVERWIIQSIAITRRIGVKPIKMAQPYFDCIAKQRAMQAAVESAASSLSIESVQYQQHLDTSTCNNSEIEASESWEDLAAITGLQSRLEEYTGLRAHITELESRLDASVTQYSAALASLQKATARAARLERRYKPQEPSSCVYKARPFFEKQWKYERRIERTKCLIAALTEKLRLADKL